LASHSFRLRCSRYDWKQKNRSAVYPNHNRQFHAQLIPFLVLFWSSYQLSQSKCQDDLKSLTIALEGSTGSVACCCDSRGKQSSYVCADNDACTSSAPLCWYVWILSAGASRNLWIRRYNLFITETNPFEPLTSNYECISRGRPRKFALLSLLTLDLDVSRSLLVCVLKTGSSGKNNSSHWLSTSLWHRRGIYLLCWNTVVCLHSLAEAATDAKDFYPILKQGSSLPLCKNVLFYIGPGHKHICFLVCTVSTAFWTGLQAGHCCRGQYVIIFFILE